MRPESGEVYLTDPWSDTDKHYPSDSWNDNGTNVYGCVKQLGLLKKRNRHLKTLLSIGGWTYSANFAAPASRDSGRREFARSSVRLMLDLGFDGLDIDWEYPKTASEAADFVALLAAVREEMASRANGRTFLLTVACPAGASNYEKMDIRGMDAYLDFWNLMAYDYAGSWDQKAGHQANLYPHAQHPETTPFSTDRAVEYYLHQGVRPEKMVLGMPLYGRAFTETNGPGHPFQGTGEGSWENGVWDYKALPKPGAEEHVDKEVGASWSYDGGKRVMVSYDTAEVVRIKSEYVRRRGLGGGMWWESSGDKVGERSLVGTFVSEIGGKLARDGNVLDFPESKFDNLKKGFPGE